MVNHTVKLNTAVDEFKRAYNGSNNNSYLNRMSAMQYVQKTKLNIFFNVHNISKNTIDLLKILVRPTKDRGMDNQLYTYMDINTGELFRAAISNLSMKKADLPANTYKQATRITSSDIKTNDIGFSRQVFRDFRNPKVGINNRLYKYNFEKQYFEVFKIEDMKETDFDDWVEVGENLIKKLYYLLISNNII